MKIIIYVFIGFVLLLPFVISNSNETLNPPVITGGEDPNCLGIGLNWNTVNNATGYHIQKQVDNGSWFDLTPMNYVYNSYNDFSFTTTGSMVCNHTYSYRIFSDSNSIESTASNILSFNIGVNQINNISLTGNISNEGIGLNWNIPSPIPQYGYRIELNVDNTGWFDREFDGWGSNAYNDFNVKSNHIYQYQIQTSAENPTRSSNIISLDTHNHIFSGYNIQPPFSINASQIDPNSFSVINGTFLGCVRINPTGMSCASNQVGFNTVNPIGNLDVNGAIQGNNNNIVFDRLPHKATTIWFNINGTDGKLHPRASITEYQNGTLLFSKMIEDLHGFNHNIPYMRMDSSGKIYMYYIPDILFNNQWITPVFNSDHTMGWQVDPSFSMTDCYNKNNCQ